MHALSSCFFSAACFIALLEGPSIKVNAGIFHINICCPNASKTSLIVKSSQGQGVQDLSDNGGSYTRLSDCCQCWWQVFILTCKVDCMTCKYRKYIIGSNACQPPSCTLWHAMQLRCGSGGYG